jgi:hypothetical protein
MFTIVGRTDGVGVRQGNVGEDRANASVDERRTIPAHVIERASETAPILRLEHLVQRPPRSVAEERNARLVRPVRPRRFTEDERGHRALRGEERGDMCAQDALVW